LSAFWREPESSAQVAGDEYGEHAANHDFMPLIQRRFVIFQPVQQHLRIFRSQYGGGWRQRHQVYGALAGSQGHAG